MGDPRRAGLEDVAVFWVELWSVAGMEAGSGLVLWGRNKAPRTSFEMRGDFKLATSYFRRAYRPTIIGATVFHFRVRKGNGWGHCAMVTRLPTTRVRHDWVSGDKNGILFLENCIQVENRID